MQWSNHLISAFHGKHPGAKPNHPAKAVAITDDADGDGDAGADEDSYVAGADYPPPIPTLGASATPAEYAAEVRRAFQKYDRLLAITHMVRSDWAEKRTDGQGDGRGPDGRAEGAF